MNKASTQPLADTSPLTMVPTACIPRHNTCNSNIRLLRERSSLHNLKCSVCVLILCFHHFQGKELKIFSENGKITGPAAGNTADLLGRTAERSWKSQVNIQMSQSNINPRTASLSSDELEIAPCYGNALFLCCVFVNISTDSNDWIRYEHACQYVRVHTHEYKHERSRIVPGNVSEDIMVAYQIQARFRCHSDDIFREWTQFHPVFLLRFLYISKSPKALESQAQTLLSDFNLNDSGVPSTVRAWCSSTPRYQLVVLCLQECVRS